MNLLRITVSILLGLLLALPLTADDRQLSDYQAKAAFIANASYYVTWPAMTAGEALTIGVLGKGSVGSEWHSISGKTFHGKNIKVIKSSDLDELLDCHIIYIDEHNPKRLARIILYLKDRPVLTVGDAPQFVATGGMVQLFIKENRLAFGVNLKVLRSTGLEMSSNLLRLASDVSR